MAQLMFRCPYTNRIIASGVELYVHNLRAMSDLPISVQCPHCGLRHHGTIGDGCLSADSAAAAEPALTSPPEPQRMRPTQRHNGERNGKEANPTHRHWP